MNASTVPSFRRWAVVGLGVALAALPANAGYSSTSLIDIPGSEYLDHLQLEGDFIAAVSGDKEVPNYGVLNFNLGVGGMSEIGAAVYSFWEEAAVAAHFKVELIDEEHYGLWQPSVSFGMDNLTPGDGVISPAGRRLPSDTASYDLDFKDNISPFVVVSKTIGNLGTFHAGWGTGRFVGKGPYSNYFRGVMLGYNRRVWRTLEVIVEEDGRDVNLGVRHSFPWVTVGTSVEKAEQIGRTFSPFYSITVEFSPRRLHRGPERLAARRQINELKEQLRSLRASAEKENRALAALRAQVKELMEQCRREGVTSEDAERLQQEIADLQRQLEAAKAAGTPVKKGPAGAGI